MTKSFCKLALLCAALASTAAAQSPTPSPTDLARWSREAASVTITRDDWGIPHISGKTDADAVFGLLYAQAEDDFNRVETNYFDALGRAAESEGEGAIYRDLRMRLINNPDSLKALYSRSPSWLQSVMNAWADGLNYYLYKHPDVKPKVIAHFEPWMPLAFSDGSIGPDIESVNLSQLAAFYGAPRTTASALTEPEHDPDRGSNGIAIGPQNTLSHHAFLLINPHTSFFFRSEVQLTSGDGLNAYGAVTWGQFFIYQGFNAHTGWMHSSTGIDVVDEFAEKVERRGNGYCYWYGRICRPMGVRPVTIRYLKPDGTFGARSIPTYRTHRGPIVRAVNGRWIAFAMMDKPIEALQQSFLRTKASDLRSFLAIADRFKANSSNNTIFADDKGEIAYLHPQFVPKRDDHFDYTKPVDGSGPSTDWHVLHVPNELPSVLSPG